VAAGTHTITESAHHIHTRAKRWSDNHRLASGDGDCQPCPISFVMRTRHHPSSTLPDIIPASISAQSLVICRGHEEATAHNANPTHKRQNLGFYFVFSLWHMCSRICNP
jgi:hypothetical protein